MKIFTAFLFIFILVMQADAQVKMPKTDDVKTRLEKKPATSPSGSEATGDEDEYKLLYDKIKPLFEMANLNRRLSGQTYSDLSQLFQPMENLSAEEVKNFPAMIQDLMTRNKRAKQLQFQYDEFVKAFGTGNEIIRNILLKLKADYGYMDKPDFTVSQMDAFNQGIREGKILFGFLASVFPNTRDYQSYSSQATEMAAAVKKKLDAKYAANYSGPFHSSHAGQVLLSATKIEIGKENAAQFKSSFTAGESIRGVLYLQEKVKVYNSNYNYIALEVFFDEAISENRNSKEGCFGTSYKTIELSDASLEKAYITFDLFPDGLETNNIPAAYVKKMTECMKNLLPGRHRVRVQVGLLPGGMTTAWTSSNTFITDFDFEVTEEGMKALAEKVAKIEAAELAAVRMGKPGLKDAQMLQLVKEAAAKNGHTPLRSIIVSPEWINGTTRDALGRTVPSYKRLYCEYAFKAADGKCYIQSVDIIREYAGNGTYSAPFTMAGKDFRKAILCENIEK